MSLFVADTWSAILLFSPHHSHRAGSVPDLFWFWCYMLIPLAAMVRLRLSPAELLPRAPGLAENLTWRDVLASIQFIAPSVAVVAAGGVILLTAAFRSHGTEQEHIMIAPAVVSSALLLLALLRPAVMFLEQEQLRRERDRALAREDALRLAQTRMQTFLAVLAHELKTPLTNLFGNVQLMASRLDALVRRDDASREDYVRGVAVQRTLVGYCEYSLVRMDRLVEDVLDETHVRQGRLALHLEPCDLVAVVGTVVVEQRALNPERDIRLVAEADTEQISVLADAHRIQQVVANVVSNALKFSRDDQAVDVRMQTKDGEVLVAVHDEGIGIPAAEQPHIWEQFFQAEGAAVQSGSQIGMGVGLYISKAIVEAHHGQVGVESAPQQGTTVWFTLPLPSPSTASSP